MCHKGSFREDINEKCILYKNADNGIKHVINEWMQKIIEYHYYSKKFSYAKTETKKDNRGIKLIKEFLLTMYKKFGAVINKRDDE